QGSNSGQMSQQRLLPQRLHAEALEAQGRHSMTLRQSLYLEQRAWAFCGMALGLKNTLLSLTSLDTVVGETFSLRAISRNELPSLSMSSISHLSSKPRCAPFFSGMTPSFPGPGERFAHGRRTAPKRKAPYAQAKRPSQRAGAYA